MKRQMNNFFSLLLTGVLLLGNCLTTGVISQAAEEEPCQAEKAFDANSWRYSGGELLQQESKARSGYAYAWEMVDGQYRNDQGAVIEGAKKKGIDVSEWQGRIDWEKVKADGIDYAIIRCGWGMDETNQDDDWWEYNVSECERLEIPYGVYLYSYADTTARASSEADHVLRLLKGHNPTYPVYFDMEDSSTTYVGTEMLGKIAKTFCDKITAAGYQTGIYANLNWWNNYLTSPVFENTSWSKWVAQYYHNCTYEGGYDMWQCTSSGKVDGIQGNTDLNFWMGEVEDTDSGNDPNRSIIQYISHLETYGWGNLVENGSQSGRTGESKRLEAIKIMIGEGYGDLGVKYSAHVQSYGWQDYVADGAIAGTIGESKRLEAIRIELTGQEAEKYDIYYRAHVQSYGWLDWASNGQIAGSLGYGKRLEAIQIQVVEKGTEAPGNTGAPYRQALISYRTHVQTNGWNSYVYDGTISGTTGQAKRLEAIRIQIADSQYKGQIRYRTHVQTYGWQNWVGGGQPAGTTGQAKRLEAIQIELTGSMAERYDVYYRVHSQTYGWLGWAKNGEKAGTEGLAKRLEAIQVQIVEKGSAAPGNTGGAFVKK